MGSVNDHRKAAELIKEREEVLAGEFLRKGRVFGLKADIDEMAKFKTKIRKEEPPKEEKKEEL